MKIKNKIIYILSGLFLLLLLWTFLLYQFYALPSVTKLEKQTQLRFSSLVSKAIDVELNRLATVTRDWATREDLSLYAQQPSEAFRDTNLADSTLIDLHIDILVIFDHSGKQLAYYWSQQASERAFDHQQSDPIAAFNNAIFQSQDRMINGVVSTNVGPVAMSATPILKTVGEGEAETVGHFIIGKILGEAFTTHLSELFDSRITITEVPFPAHASTEFTLTTKSMSVSRYLPLINASDSSIMVTNEQPRSLFMQERHIAAKMLFIILLTAILVCIVMFLLLDRIIVRPLAALEHRVKRFESHHELPPLVTNKRSDEIGELSRILFKIGHQVKDSWSQLRAERNDYLKASNTDPLTKLWNRRYVEQTLSSDSTWSKPDNWLFMMIDIDHFKQINDNFGHDAGDIAIRQMASVLRYLSRTDDIVMRYGGEEFTLICRGVDEKVGRVIAERIRGAIESRRFGQQGASFKVTCSIGFFNLWVDSGSQENSLALHAEGC